MYGTIIAGTLQRWLHLLLLQVSAYVVDYDVGTPSHGGLAGRQSTVALLDRATLNAAAPLQFISADQSANGVWLTFQTNSSARLRFSQIVGDTVAVSALAFDVLHSD